MTEETKKQEDFSNKKASEELTKLRLKQLEEREKTPLQKKMDILIMALPFFCCGIAILEYILIPNNLANPNPYRYVALLLFFISLYAIYLIYAVIKNLRGDFTAISKVRYYAPLFSVIYLFLALYDFLTLKTGILTQPFIPCVNHIINAGVTDYKILIESTYHTLVLLFTGYFVGVVTGLITGIACGYSKRVRYWLNPIINILGPIPTATWIPIVMVLAASLYMGAIFVISLGAWFAVTVATMTGISNVDLDYFQAAKTLGASRNQLVTKIAIPAAVPSILQGATQAMSSACVSIIVAEMLGVEAGLGWYMTWQKSWAAYDKMFAALIIICLVFITVTNVLDRIKRHLLRWQVGRS